MEPTVREGGLCLTRSPGEGFQIGDTKVTFISRSGKQIRVLVQAPEGMEITRFGGRNDEANKERYLARLREEQTALD